MINYMLLCCCVVATGCQSNSSVGYDHASIIDTSQIIDNAEREVGVIDSNMNTYYSMEKEVDDESIEGTILIGYYEKGELKKIAGTYYGETGKMLIEYYMNNENFFYVNSETFNYKTPIYADSRGEIQSVRKDTYYFHNKDLIKWNTESNNNTNVNSLEFRNKSIYFKEKFKDYKTYF